ncbi:MULTISPECIES: Crp/Fnr family transcriptional regulator [Microvirga]|uniref:Helix-turn-helix domain-containing protein n=2 Tax=Microvirga TaxID=186650 RepID=A0ABW9Z1Z0_9HYPH|nr:Crp/Fnr family transcriptional regulator [Microvirga arsenatis]NBJ12805.1 helix-turn-helix domain-containing protein [Microvirga arsenatis]NBJ26664.1 helix-turn-helix domain-containing protein [Microvirga arsenatis]
MSPELNNTALAEPVGCLCPDPRAWRLEDLPCTLETEDESRSFLIRQGGRRTVGPNEAIFAGGPTESRCFRVLEGVVRLVTFFPDGARQIVRFAFPGDYFGLTHAERLLTAEAVSPVVLLEFDAGKLQRLGECNPLLGRQLANVLRASASEALDHVGLLGRKDARKRLALFLRFLHQNIGLGDIVSVPMSRSDIADFVGLKIETVSRAFGYLRRRHLIDDVGRGVLRLDLVGLDLLIDGEG